MIAPLKKRNSGTLGHTDNNIYTALFCIGLISILTSGATVSAEPATTNLLPPAPQGSKWELVPELTDEFKGNELDSTKWQPFLPYWKGRAPSQFAPTNVRVRQGNLELQSTSIVDSIESVKNPLTDIWVHASCVSSLQPIAGYGYFEARVKASRLSMTSSFWLQGKYSEVDIAEQMGSQERRPDGELYMFMCTHYFAESWKNDKFTPKKWKMPAAAADVFHVYGAWWKDKNTVWFYHDGEKVAEVKTGGEFLEPMYLIFDTEVFTADIGIPTVESLKNSNQNTMLVNWVHVWRLVSTGELGKVGP